jgi:hypothetical protein
MFRDRFKLISRYISFDDIDTRVIRANNKFHEMEATFNHFKRNLNLNIYVQMKHFMLSEAVFGNIYQVNQLALG